MSVQFSVSQQHYLFGVQTFAHTVLALGGDDYSYALRDRTTEGVLDDVAAGLSELGVIVQTKAPHRWPCPQAIRSPTQPLSRWRSFPTGPT